MAGSSSNLPRVLITDLDNTLWDWFHAWHESFSALIDGLEKRSGISREVLESEIRQVHQKRGTTEYSNLVREVPSLVRFAGSKDPFEVFDAALHAQSSRRLRATALYPRVSETLNLVKAAGIRVVAYTESGAFWTEWRIKRTGLDGVIDVLYSSPDHDAAAGVTPERLRTGHYDDSHYGLEVTTRRTVGLHATKPNPEVLEEILRAENCRPSQAVYVGDSLMKDIGMAQSVGVTDVFAYYGTVQQHPGYDLLRRVSHWSDQEVAYERSLSEGCRDIVPTNVCTTGLWEILEILGATIGSSI